MRSKILASLSLFAAFGMTMPAWAQGAVTLKPTAGHPNLPVTLSGSGFGHSEAIDIYVDTVDTLLLVSSATGTFSGSVSIPASAQPGKHYVTAIGRHSGDAAQGIFSVTTPWSEQGFGAAHLGWNPYENTLNTGDVGTLGILWQIPANALGSAPAVAGGRVFVGTNAGLEAVSTSTGSVLWKALASTLFYASPAVVGATLYIGDGNNALMYALNATTGAVIWSQSTGGAFESSPVVVGNLVYAGGLDGKIYAFSTSTGKIAWTFTTGNFIDSSPAVVNGTLYVGSTDHSIYALNAATGALIWSYTTGGEVESAVAVSNGVVYVGSDDNKVYAINAAGSGEGSLRWSYTTGGLVYSSPAVAYGSVYVGSSDGNMYALNARNGALEWDVATGGALESPAVANGVVYVSNRNNSILAIDANYGEIRATGVAGFSFLGNPTISDGVVYFNTYGYNTYAFSLLAGTDAVRAHAQPPSPSSLHPDMRLVVGH
jgi:outer membrane protein assembly factor BamB